MVEMIRLSRSAGAFVTFTSSRIKNPKSAQTTSLILSHILCIDDYLSSLTVGSVLRPITDHFRIARVKLAFLAGAMAAPLAILTPISSWAAALIGFLTDTGVSGEISERTLVLASPYSLYLSILPYIFYSITVIITVWVIVRCDISFGLLQKHDQIAKTTGNLLGGKMIEFSRHQERPTGKREATVVDFFLPIGSLLGFTLLNLLYFGGFWLFGGDNSLLDALRLAPISLVLFLSGALSLSLSSAYYLATGKFYVKELAHVFASGLRLMFPVSIMLVLAWTMGSLLREDLHTGTWIASMIAGAIPMEWLPFILFVNSGIIALFLGSSWATVAILFPIAIPMVMSMMGLNGPSTIEEIPILLPVFGAILSGAVAGNHVALISDTTIMATSSSGCDLLDYVKAQCTYAIPIFAGTSLGYLAAGYFAKDIASWPYLLLCQAIALGSTLAIIQVLKMLWEREEPVLEEQETESASNVSLHDTV